MNYIDFLRYCLGLNLTNSPDDAKGIDWNNLLSWAERQVTELLCLQLEKLPLIAEHALEMVSFC